MTKRIVLAGGGTAGHIEPALAVADALKRLDPTLEIEFIGTASGLESLLVPQRGYRLRTIPKVALPRKFAMTSLLFPLAIFKSVYAARRILMGADSLIGFGGYVSASAYLGAKLARVPIAIHEANAKPGWANRLGRHFAKLVAVNFEEVRVDWAGSILTGMPIRSAISELAKLSDLEREKFRELNAKSLGLDPARPIISIFGGSQGSLQINNAVRDYLAKRVLGASNRFQIVHAVGINNPLPQPESDYLPMAYFHDMAAIYGISDLLITRSGAVTCSELMTAARFAILVPLAHGNGEQVDNAQALVDQGRAVLIKNENFTGTWLQENLERIIAIAEDKALSSAELHLKAADRIATLVLDLILTESRGRN